MKDKVNDKSIFRRGRACFCNILAACLLLTAANSALAQTNRYLTAGRPDGIALLPPPPAEDSAEQAADLASARAVFDGRTQAETTRAVKDSTLAFSLFAPVIGPMFQRDQLPKTFAVLDQVKAELGSVIDPAKNHFKRKRPYQVDAHFTFGAPEPSFGYPSGHSVRGTVYSLVLAEIFPQQKEAILALGRDIGWDRVLIGKHFPTDVIAGRVVGKAIVQELLASRTFRHDLAEARRELATLARKSAEPPREAAPLPTSVSPVPAKAQSSP
jgi:acid phosphatase (class A)